MNLKRASIDRHTVGGWGVVLALCACAAGLSIASDQQPTVEIVGAAELFAPGIASTESSEVRLTVSPDGQTALWFSRNRPGGAGGYDIWMSKRTAEGWSDAKPVPFNSAKRDFDPAFSPDGRSIYFCSDRPGTLGGDDLYRVDVTKDGFGEPENLGAQINSAGNEWAPMLSADATLLLFSSDGRGGAGRMDLFTARRLNSGAFETALPLPGKINTPGDEFDATFLSDNATVVFSKAANLREDRINLVYSSLRDGSYDAGTVLPASINSSDQDSYGPMLDWSRKDQLTFSSQRKSHIGSVDLYVVRYRLAR